VEALRNPTFILLNYQKYLNVGLRRKKYYSLNFDTSRASPSNLTLNALQRDDSFIGAMLCGSSFSMPLAITLCDRLSEIEIGFQNSHYGILTTVR
jgi:hypothetical protein